ncbi:hypothetical protein MK614_RS23005, partial [Escherichia coli]
LSASKFTTLTACFHLITFLLLTVITQKYAPVPQQIIYFLCCFFMPHPLLWHQKISDRDDSSLPECSMP